MYILHIGVFENDSNMFITTTLSSTQTSKYTLQSCLEVNDLEAAESMLGSLLDLVSTHLKDIPNQRLAVRLHTIENGNRVEQELLGEIFSAEGVRSSPKLMEFARHFVDSYFQNH